MKAHKYWLNLLLFFFIIFFTNTAYAVDIKLDGNIVKINGDTNNNTCHSGDIFRLSNTTTYKGQAFDILIKVLAEANEADTLDNPNDIFPQRPCIGVNNELIEFILRDRADENGNNDADTNASMDLEITTVKQGTLEPLLIDRIQFTALDLDRSGDYTLSDDIYLSSPGRGFTDDTNQSLVTIEAGVYGNGYDIRLQGNRDKTKPVVPVGQALSFGNCNDTLDNPQPECRASGVLAINEPTDKLRIRVSNDNAFGAVSSDNKQYYRLIQVSLEESSLVILGIDHGDMPKSYGDAYNDINISFVLGTTPADGEDGNYTDYADADGDDNNDSQGEDYDDEDAVSIVGVDTNGTSFDLTQGYNYEFNVTTTGNGYLSAWIDYDRDGSFDANEKIIDDRAISSVTSTYTIIPVAVPSSSLTGKSYLRFRFSENQGVNASGNGGNGEVEDYAVNIVASGSVNGHVYDDKNGNLTQDAGESGLSNASVTITAENGETQTTTTNTIGDYSFSGVAVGNASVEIDETTLPTGVKQTEGTNATEVPVIANQINTEENNGYQLQVDLVTNKTVDKPNPQEGETIVYTLSVANNGPSDATNVSLTDVLPAEVSYVGSNPSQGDYNSATGLWNIGNIANGVTATVEITATVNLGTSGNSITNVSTMATTPDANDTTPGGDDLDETVNVGGRPVVTISDVTVVEGEALVFDINLSSPSNFDTVIHLSTVNGTAVAQDDFVQLTAQPVTIPANSTGTTVSVGSTDDNDDELTETFILQGTIVSGNTQNTEANGTGTILDNDVNVENDSATGTIGQPVVIDVLANDNGNDINASSVKIVGAPGDGKTLVVQGEGTWSVNPTTGEITFTPENGFAGDPTPIQYTVKDNAGYESGPATVNVNYIQTIELVDDNETGTVGTPVTVNVLENDESDNTLDPSTVRIKDGDNNVTELIVDGEGIWKVEDNGSITFTPEVGFTGDPTPIEYVVSDVEGTPAQSPATVTIDYAQGTVAGAVYEDSNGNASQDPNEPGIEGVKVEITDANGVKSIVVTDANGQYAKEVPVGQTNLEIDENTLPKDNTQTEGSNPTEVTVPENGIATDIDGYKPADNAGRIEGLVYEDTNGNNNQDTNESGIEGVKVIITESGKSRVVTTDQEGKYSVTVAPGSVTVDIDDSTVPGGSTHTEGTDPLIVVVTENETKSVIDGYKPAEDRGTIKGVVYVDLNGDGTQDANEPGLEGVTVTIKDAEGHTQTLKTDENGTYETKAPIGEAFITIDESTLPGGSKQTEGSNPTPVTVEKDTTVTDTDGYQPPENNGKLEGVVYDDTNGNGSQDPGEIGIEDVRVSVIDSKASIQTFVTDVDGKYSTLIVVGDVVVDIAQEDLGQNYRQTEGTDPTTTLTVTETGVAKDVDGFVQSSAPMANPDKAEDIPAGTAVTIDVLSNDTDAQDNIDPTTVRIVGAPGDGKTLEVPGEGTWTVDPTTGAITFTPEDGFTGDPSPIQYTVKDLLGEESNPASVEADYIQTIPDAIDDNASAEVGDDVEINILDNDIDTQDDINVSTVDLIPPTGIDGNDTDGDGDIDMIIVPNEGTWTVDEEGVLTFTPVDGFTGDPTPITYTVSDNTGGTSEPATVTIDVSQQLRDDNGVANVGHPITLDILVNDDDVVASTISLVAPNDDAISEDTDGDGDIDKIIVDGEGIWTVDESGNLTFTPQAGFTGDPTPITYTAQDSLGNVLDPATVTIVYIKPKPTPVPPKPAPTPVPPKPVQPQSEPETGGLENEIEAIDDNLTVLHYNEYTMDASINDIYEMGTFNLINPATSELVPEGQTVELSYGIISMDANGTYRYSPYANAKGVDNIQYMIQDGTGLSSSALITINVDCASTQESDGDALSFISMIIMLLMTGAIGLYYVRKEELTY